MVKEQFFRTNVPFGVIIYREARRNNLPPELVAAVVETESDFRPRLISHKNAQGLMQIIPSTAEFIGAGDLFNPRDNIAAGTKYLRYLYDRFNGDQKMVLAAYNAGEGNVEKFGGIPPFPETINYLQRVNTRTKLYRDRVRATVVSSVRIHNSLRSH
jgi:soluble lytic murein transglycosylase-like protein